MEATPASARDASSSSPVLSNWNWQRMLTAVLETMSEGVVVVDAKGVFVHWNPAALRMVPPGPRDVAPTEWSKIYSICDPETGEVFPAEQLPLARALQGEVIAPLELSVVEPSGGRERIISTSAEPLYDEHGILVGAVAVFQDVTERRWQEEERRRSHETLRILAQSVSHDLRSPLLVVQGFTEALREEFNSELGASGREYLDHIQDSAERMRRLIDELLEHARFGDAWDRPGPVDLQSVVQIVLDNLRGEIRESGAQILVRTPLPTITAHAPGVQSLFQNLLANALKFVAPGVPPQVELGCDDVGDSWELWVKDNGIGIDPRYHERIFRIFERLHPRERYQGTGVGLALVRKVADLHGGHVWVESRPGSGALFRARLPKRPRARRFNVS